MTVSWLEVSTMVMPRAPLPYTRHVSVVPGARVASTSFSLLLAVLLFHCSGGGDGEGASMSAGGSDACPNDLPSRQACSDGAPSYRQEVAPIVDERCNLCHYSGNTQSSVVLSDYDAVFARRRTVQSRIYACVMPPAPAPPLTPAERATLLEWLVCDAPDD